MSHIQVADSGIAMNKTLMKQRQPETILAGQVFGVTSPQFQDISIEKKHGPSIGVLYAYRI